MRVVLATVVGPAGQQDLSLPADTPTAELLPALVHLLSGSAPRPPAPAGPSVTAHPPPTARPAPTAGAPTAAPGVPHGSWPDQTGAWALITAAGQPVPPWTSLAEHGVLHGEHLYLVAHAPLPPRLRHLKP